MSITHHDHIVFIIFEVNDETIIMHINTLYFSYMKPLIKIHSVMYHGKCTSKFEFSWKWQRGFIHVSFTCWIQVFCSNKIQSTDLLHNILCSLCFNNYFVVMILDNGMMIWIKNILKISFFCQTKGLLHGEKILVQYTCTNNEKQKQDIYISM